LTYKVLTNPQCTGSRFVQNKLCETEFLPVMKKPTNFPLRWCEDELHSDNKSQDTQKEGNVTTSGAIAIEPLDNSSKKGEKQQMEDTVLEPTTQVILRRPVDLYPSECRDYICCVRPVVDESVYPSDSSQIQTFLKMSGGLKEPSVEEVNTQDCFSLVNVSFYFIVSKNQFCNKVKYFFCLNL